MLYHLGSISIILFEVICMNIFFETFCGQIRNKKKRALCYFSIFLVTFLCALFLSNWLLVKQICICLSITILLCIFYRTNFLRAFILPVLCQGLMLAIDYLALVTDSRIFLSEDIAGQQYVVKGSLIIVFYRIVLLICMLLIRKLFGRKKTDIINNKDWLKILVFPVYSMIIIALMISQFQYVANQPQAEVLYITAVGMCIMNIFAYYLINSILEREAQLQEKRLFEIQVKNQVEMYNSIAENFERQKQKTHEFKNHILCVEGLIKTENYKELESYVEKISEGISNERELINTNNTIVNTILNSKYNEAVKKGIVFVCQVNDLSRINIDDNDMVVLLANLLNNAMEACEKCDTNRVIKVKFIMDKEIIIGVQNTSNQPIIYREGEIVTSKSKEPEEHGVGIKNIIKVVEKYKGYYTIDSKDNEFKFSIIIPL